MANYASPPPVRTNEGGTTDMPFQPLADCGAGNQFFYHTYTDEFDATLGVTGWYTQTPGASVTNTAGDGGLALFTTGAVSGNQAELQLPAATFTITAGKKMFFQTRAQISVTATTTAIWGLCNTGGTPFTAVTDGVYFKWVGGSGLTINSTVGSVVTAVTIPAAAYSFGNATNMDLAFYITRLGDVLAFVDTQLVGYIPQSQIGTAGNPQNAGAVARITAPSLTTAALNVTLAVQTNSANARTMTVDYVGVNKER